MVFDADISITDDTVALVSPGIDVIRAKAVDDGKHRLAFPGVVDAHMQSGIYSLLEEDAVSESKAAAMGGVNIYAAAHCCWPATALAAMSCQ